MATDYEAIEFVNGLCHNCHQVSSLYTEATLLTQQCLEAAESVVQSWRSEVMPLLTCPWWRATQSSWVTRLGQRRAGDSC